MRKVIVFNRITLDGFFAGPNGEIDWFVPDPDLDKAAHEMMRIDTLLLGRVTYQMFESHWPHVKDDPNAPAGARVIADELDQVTKVVFSHTLKEVTWKNTTLVKDDLVGWVRQLKQGNGTDIAIFGSGTIVQQLTKSGLMDEALIAVSPVIAGKGKLLFPDVGMKSLGLLESRHFPSSNVLLHYRFT